VTGLIHWCLSPWWHWPLAYLILCVCWFVLILLLTRLLDSDNVSGDAGLAIFAIAVIPLLPFFLLVNWVLDLRRRG
jgi:hypothetical protein